MRGAADLLLIASACGALNVVLTIVTPRAWRRGRGDELHRLVSARLAAILSRAGEG